MNKAPIITEDRELVLATALLLNLINKGDVRVQLFYKDSPPGQLTPQTIYGMGVASTALCAFYGITQAEIDEFTKKNLTNHERTH